MPRRSIAGSLALLAFDMGTGSFLWSSLVCPIWLLVSLARIPSQRPRGTALAQVAIPVMTLAVVLANSAVQSRVAKANAEKVVAACEQFHADHGRFPRILDELVPEYLAQVPRAKYCVLYGQFLYINRENHPILIWFDIPPHGRPNYDFQARRWGYVD